jgi:hypothetical protein
VGALGEGARAVTWGAREEVGEGIDSMLLRMLERSAQERELNKLLSRSADKCPAVVASLFRGGENRPNQTLALTAHTMVHLSFYDL